MITKERREALMRRFSETVAAGGGTIDVRDTEEETLVRFWVRVIQAETLKAAGSALLSMSAAGITVTQEGGAAG
ncbi:MAG: hypothetical protein IJI97_08295 [Clostridia bacterium]|nr:hypothetical protein [Clostridia bacterium]